MGAAPLDDLREELAAGQAVVVVGAGVSVAATGGASTASWVGLLNDGVAYCEALLGPSLPPGWAERRRGQVASGDLDELVGAAEDLTRRLGGPGGGEFGRWLAASIGQLGAASPAVLEALAALGVPLATTNYDGLLEAVTGRPPVTWRQSSLFEQVLRGDRKAVLHLHGHWEDPESVVLGVRSYEAVVGNAHAEAMRKALATTRSLVFVGCGAGLEDPNFGALRRWLAGVFASSPYRHYRLCLAQELADLWREHGLDERIVPVAYGERHDDLAPFLHRLVPQTTVRPASAATLAAAGQLPPSPRCFGRDAIVEDLVATLLAEPPPPTPVLGPAGIGKSTVCVTALHDQRVAERYGERRYFVRCNAAMTGEAVLAEVAATLGLPVGPDLQSQALAHLSQAPCALVLDNAETPWWADPAGAEESFATLAAVPALALVASLRGRQRPFGLAWRDAIDVSPLATAETREVFLAVAGQSFEDDPHLDPLIGAQDGLPLTTTLLAYLAEGEPDLDGLWRRWTERRVALLDRGVGGHDLSVEASFDLSINSDRMTDEARRLLSLLAVLPDGIAHDDLDAVLPEHAGEAASSLRKVGLAFDGAGRLRMLQPIHDHVQAKHAPRPDDLARIATHYAALAETLGWQVEYSGGVEARTRLLAERGNLQTMIARGLDEHDPRPAIRAAKALSEFMRYSGLGSAQLLEAASDAAGKLGEVGLQADTLLVLGGIAFARSDHDTAQARYEQAQSLYEQVGNVKGRAYCIWGLGNIARVRSDHDTAQARYKEAQPLYEQVGNVHGQANCIAGLGDIALARSDDEAARVRYEEALALYERIPEPYSIGVVQHRLATLASTESERDERLAVARQAWASIGRTDLVETLR